MIVDRPQGGFMGSPPPVIIGGMGGSGTRLIADLLIAMDYFLGGDLNESTDNLTYTLLFKRLEILGASPSTFHTLTRILVQAMTTDRPLHSDDVALVRSLARPRVLHDAEWLEERVQALLRPDRPWAQEKPWGWKEPNSHIVIDRFIALMPGLRYIHVIRNGLDMAFSNNQNQLRMWGPNFIGRGREINPCHALKFWRLVHERVIEMCQPLGDRFLMLNYDEFCINPAAGIRQLQSFLNIDLSASRRDELAAMAAPPTSIGRFKRHSLDAFNGADVEYVAQLGFSIR